MVVTNDLMFSYVPKIPDERGNLSFFQCPDQVPFEIKKVYWINDIPSGTAMEGCAHLCAQEVVIALTGSFDVILYDGQREYAFTLNRPDMCLHIPAMIWRRMENFSTNSVVLVATDEVDASGRLVDFKQFQRLTHDEKLYSF